MDKERAERFTWSAGDFTIDNSKAVGPRLNAIGKKPRPKTQPERETS